MAAAPAIRQASEDDAAAIARVHVDSWRAAYGGIMPAVMLDELNVDERAEHWAAILRGEVPVPGVGRPDDVVAVIGEHVVGFANVGEYRGDPSPEAAELWAMYVHPDHWRSGVGSALMGQTVSRFNEMGATVGYLWVLEDNQIGRSFYERSGWRFVDVPEARKSIEVHGTEVFEVRYQIDL